jgi:hypothetical protein
MGSIHLHRCVRTLDVASNFVYHQDRDEVASAEAIILAMDKPSLGDILRAKLDRVQPQHQQQESRMYNITNLGIWLQIENGDAFACFSQETIIKMYKYYCKSQNKVEMIKDVRTKFSSGLKEAKDFVDAVIHLGEFYNKYESQDSFYDLLGSYTYARR